MAIAKLPSTPNPIAGSVRYCAVCLAVYRQDFKRCPNDGGELLIAVSDPLLGQTIGQTYVVEELIGEGAMSRVYRARHHALVQKRYAVKVLLGDMAASATMRTRFAREAENASRLDHPNVVNVIDYGRTPAGLHYLVMDLVDGETLTTLIRRGPMPAARVIRIAHQLCEGLDHAHARGMIHRDFKPDNILVVGEVGREVARIADFGLSMKTSAEARLTTNGVACTPAYAAPEQLRGQHFDHRVDLYALGVTMFEMLSGGYLPFDGDIDATVRAKLGRDAPSILTRAPHVPPGLVTLLGKLLAQEPSDRLRSARAVIRALETSLTLPRPPIRTVEMRPLVKRARQRRRGRLRSVLAWTVLTATVVLGVGIGHFERVEMPDVRSAAAEAMAVVVEPIEQAPEVEAVSAEVQPPATDQASDTALTPIEDLVPSPLANVAVELAHDVKPAKSKPPKRASRRAFSRPAAAPDESPPVVEPEPAAAEPEPMAIEVVPAAAPPPPAQPSTAAPSAETTDQ